MSKYHERNFARILSLLIIVALVFQSVFATGYAGTVADDDKAVSSVATGRGLDIDEGYLPGNANVISQTSWQLAPGITETEIVTNVADGNRQIMEYACTMDPGKNTVKLVTGYKDYDASKWGLDSVTDQAKAYQAKHPDERVVAAINADFFNMTTGEPIGAMVMNGTVYHEANGRPYFAILKDGTPVIRDGNVPLTDVQQAVGGASVILRNGEPTKGGDTRYYTRQSIGIKADGTVVTVTSRGINPPISYGRTVEETGELLKAMGCVWGLELDGGGSATFSSRREGESMDDFQMRSFGQDGAERNVSSTLLFVSTAKGSGEFDHFSISPNNTIYTQKSEVQFNAQAVDSSGEKIDADKIPEGITWELDENSKNLGVIDQNGKFTSNGVKGEVTVNKVTTDGQKVGSTVITICAPDEISWQSDEISLGFAESSNLGMIAKYKGREVVIKDGDFNWTITPDAGYEDYIGREDDIGTFDGNTFTSSEGNTVNATLTATYAHEQNGASSSIHAIIGRLPSIVMDFEDTDSTAAKDYWTFDKAIINANGGTIQCLTDDWKTARMDGGSYVKTTDKKLLIGQYGGVSGAAISGRGGNSSAEIVNIGSGQPVRFGNNSLKLNYDFTKINGIEGACVGFSEQSQEIEGNPTGIGMWVYAPEGTPNLWLRIRVLDGQGNVLTLDFTERMNDAMNASGNKNYGGINWTGWKYVEADLSKRKGPFKLLGGETIRLMHTNGAYGVEAGKGMGDYLADGTEINRADCKGSIYIDNLRFVYGANVDDTLTPVIDSITANGNEIKNGDVITSNKISFKSAFHDVEDKYATGIDYSTVYVFLDGKDVSTGNTDNYHLIESDNELRLDDVVLSNGTHKIKVLLRDGFGNEITEEREFTVNGNQSLPEIFIEKAQNSPVLNQEFSLNLKASKIDEIDKLSANINLRKEYLDGINVTFSSDFEGTFTVEDGKLKISATRKTAPKKTLRSLFSNNEGVIATITCKVPSDLTEGSKFTYSVTDGQYELNTQYAGDGYPTGTFSVAESSIEAEQGLSVKIDKLEVGDTGKKLYVYDSSSSAVANAEIYDGQGSKVGTTDSEGAWDVSYLCEQEATRYSFYAVKDGQYSFKIEGQSFALGGADTGKPVGVIANAVSGSGNAKLFTWLTNPKKTDEIPIVQLADKKEYDAKGEGAFKDYKGESSREYFSKSSVVANNKVARVNKVKIEGLKTNTEYVYRVGDGKTWSEIDTFKTSRPQGDVNMFLVGDTQAADTGVMESINQSLKADGREYSLGIQTGDLIENAGLYEDWIGGLNLFQAMNDIDMLHVIGNHELFGDSYGDLSEKLFALANKKYYSVEYGNVYVATISYTDNKTEYDEAFKWLEEDAKKTDCQWKILVMHQPAYYTNPNGGNGYVHDKLPASAEKAGIDFVFSGHDHAYARTEPLKNGEVDENEGIVYYICGSTGEKSYTAVANDEFHFAEVNQEYGAIYMTLSATDKKLTVETHESDGSIIDSYTKVSDNECSKSGHKYLYGNGLLDCEVCSYSRDIEGYTGWVTEKTADTGMYFIDGKYQTGWTQIGEEAYYFNAKGLQYPVEVKEDIKNTCITRGYKLYECKDAPSGQKQFKVQNPLAGGHEYKETDGKFICSVCSHERINMSDCTIKLGNTDFTYTGRPIEPFFNVTVMRDGKEITLKNGVDYYATIKDNTEVGEVTMTFTAQKVGIFVDVNEWRGNCAGSVDVTFTIHPELPKKAYVADNGTSATLKWETSKSADQYVIYQSVDGGAYREIAVTTENTYVVTGQDKSKTYKYRIRTRTVADGKTIDSLRQLILGVMDPELVIENRPEDGKPVIEINNWDKDYKYELFRSTEIYGDTFVSLGDVSQAQYVDVTAEAGQTYYYKVKITNDKGVSELSGIYAGIVACEKPQLTISEDAESRKPVLQWNVVPAAAKYEIYRATANSEKYNLLWTGEETSFTDVDAQVGGVYSYKVRAITEGGSASAFSEAVSYQYDMIKPAITESGVNKFGKPSFTWKKVEDAEKYEIFRSDSENGKYEKLTTLMETSYTDSTAEIGKVYYYKISAVAGETSATSDAVAIVCQEPIKAEVDRVNGVNRYETAVASADKLKEVYGVDKFDNIIVAYGDNYADALAGSYLAKVKKAPILLVNNAAEGYVKSYIDNNLNAGGTVYILGGEGVVSKNFADSITGYNVERLGGADRFETNLLILKEAGVTDNDILACSAWSFADSLSASSSGKPILLVDNTLKNSQKEFLAAMANKNYYIIGGEGVVSNDVVAQLDAYGNTKRIYGANRYETSKAIADAFFAKGSQALIIASGEDFPDGLTGGPLAIAMYSPIILVNENNSTFAKEYATAFAISELVVIGGTGVISDSIVSKVVM